MVRTDHGFHAHIMAPGHTAPMLLSSVLRSLGLALVIAPAAWAQADTPTATAAVSRPVPAAAAAAEPARFDVLEYEVVGNSMLPARVIEAAVLPHMGEQRSLADVDAARAALEGAYQDAGLLTVFVDVPEQRIDGGLVRLVVTEGRVERVRVTGARWFSQGYIRANTPALVEGGVPDFNQLQAQLGELNRGPDRQVQPVLRTGHAPGTMEVELKVQDQWPMSGSLELNNKHSASTSATRLVATLRHDNLLQRDQGLALTLTTAPEAPAQSQVLAASWTSPLSAASSLVTSLVWSNSRTEPLGATVLGSGLTLGLRWAHTRFGEASSHTVTLGGEFRDLKQNVGTGDSGVATPLRYLPLQAGYSGQWTHAGDGPRAQTSLAVNLAFGLRGLLARRIACPGNTLDGQQDQFACNRDGADGGFVTLRTDLRHSRPFAGGTLALRAAGQAATQALVSGEQFTLGGADTVRGYFESEAVGDMALLASLEWRSRNLLGAAAAPIGTPPLALAALVFADLARAWLIDPLPEQAPYPSLAGAGLGLQLRLGSRGSADLDLAWPLKPTRNSPSRQPRLHARVGLQF